MEDIFKIFGITELKNKQKEIINGIINEKRDVCCILPTGYGKSLCYQLPPLFLNKPGIIVSPLISLMEDQKNALQKKNISVCCYNSTINKKTLKNEILRNDYKLIYITPEQIVKSRLLLELLHDDVGISLIAIDEAHCVSVWGHSFRSQYRELGQLKEWLPNVPIIALTGTATDNVEKDICVSLNLKNPLIVKSSFDRPNLFLECKPKTTIIKDLIPIFQNFNEQVIIYCITRIETENISLILNNNNITSKSYHAGMSDKERTEIHHMFINNEIQCIVATNSFGMGIDKHNIRKIIHYGSPKDIESYYQEIGRGSRDNEKCHCITFYCRNDFILQKTLMNDIYNVKHKQYMMDKLKYIEKYMYAQTCRRKIILEYFNEVLEESYENCCDNCDYSKDSNNTMIDTSEDVKLLLNTIVDFNDKFGICTIINIIKGSKSKTLPSYCTKSIYYGKSKKTVEWWKNLCQIVTNKGLIIEKQLHDPKFKFSCVVSISQSGREYLNNNSDYDFTIKNIKK